jgi:hypothetical protein
MKEIKGRLFHGFYIGGMRGMLVCNNSLLPKKLDL